MDPIAELAEFDRETVAQAKAVEQRIQAEGFAAGHTIRDVRVFRVLMPWVGTKRWDGSAESFTFAEFETDKGLIGIAEGANADAEELKGKVLGKNPFDPSIRADMGSGLLGPERQNRRPTVGPVLARTLRAGNPLGRARANVGLHLV